jgi:toxin-antitoxin system PIN domain toxin
VSTPLLDVNVLVALFDPAHPNHEDAHRWFGPQRRRGWATCPITINGCTRVLSGPRYPGLETTTGEVIRRLKAMCSEAGHEFWEAGFSLFDESLFRPDLIAGPGQITDVYLLALAVRRNGRLATFDRSISWKAVVGANAGHLLLLGGRA